MTPNFPKYNYANTIPYSVLVCTKFHQMKLEKMIKNITMPYNYDTHPAIHPVPNFLYYHTSSEQVICWFHMIIT